MFSLITNITNMIEEKMNRQTDRQTDRQRETERERVGRTYVPTYRDARKHLKRYLVGAKKHLVLPLHLGVLQYCHLSFGSVV